MNSVNVTSQVKTQLPEEEKLQEKLRPKTAIYKHNLIFLIRRLIEKVSIYEDKFIVEFKSGVTVDVNK